jgi:hypothetical protein
MVGTKSAIPHGSKGDVIVKRLWLLALTTALLLPVIARPAAVSAQRPNLSSVRVLAIAPFADDVYVPVLARWGAGRLADLLGRAPFRVVSAPDVANAMRRLGLAPRDLTSPSRTVELGRAVGADAVLTTRVTHALREREGGHENDNRLFDGTGSRVDMGFRVLDVNTRTKLFEEEFTCQLSGILERAMECVLRDAVSHLIP